MRIARDERERREAEIFCESHPAGHFMQSQLWARVKCNWKNEVIIAEDRRGEITGVLSVLIRDIPVFGSLMYCPRGPVCDVHDFDTLRQLRDGALELAARYDALALRMEPDIPESDLGFVTLAKSLGFQIKSDIRDSRDLIQPRSVFRLNLTGRTEDEIFAGFHKKLRYNIRLAQRRGVEIREGGREDLPAFHRLMEETARRDGFITRSLEYYTRVWDSLGPDHVKLLIAHRDGKVLAAAMPIHYGRRTWYAYGASATEGRADMPCHLLQWEMIRQALSRGDEVYDLRGFLEITDESDPRSGLYSFKKRFGGDLVRFVGEVTLPNRPRAYALYRRAERAMFDVRHVRAAVGRRLRGMR